jgi:hypothetical protein
LDLAEINLNKDQLKKDLVPHLFLDSDDECGIKTSHYSKLEGAASQGAKTEITHI